MKKFTTSDRLKQIMNERGIKQVDILSACKPYCEKYKVSMRKNDLSQYISGKVEPKQDKLSILGMALNVNEVWLMGYDVPAGKDELTCSNEQSAITAKENKLISIYRNLNPAGQAQLMLQADILSKIDEYKKGPATKEQDVG